MLVMACAAVLTVGVLQPGAVGPMHGRNHSSGNLTLDSAYLHVVWLAVVFGVVHDAVVAGCGSCVRTGYKRDTYIDPMGREILCDGP